MINTQNNSSDSDLYVPIFIALFITVFGLIAFGSIEPVFAGARQIVSSDNFRRPTNDDELKYWLKNMAVLIEMRLRNGTEQRLTDLRIQNCVMTKMAAGFEQQTNDNKIFTNPYVACRSEDGKRWIITAWENCYNPWGNEKCPCFHSDPKFPDLEPGQSYRLRGWFSFYEGTDIEKEFKRIEATGWRKRPESQ
jgi:hypothetical protein